HCPHSLETTWAIVAGANKVIDAKRAAATGILFILRFTVARKLTRQSGPVRVELKQRMPASVRFVTLSENL
ncbi:MAG: hypothetical protein WBL84_04620, partial [Xanthobacteraceae bacterium]